MGVKDITGQRFGRLTVVGRAANDRYGNARWLCKCDCGNEVTANGSMMRSGHTKSCGCYQRDIVRSQGTHHMSKTAIYKAWAGMKQRCENPNCSSYHDYGARGITVCMEWHDFMAFYDWAIEQGYKPGLTIERKNNSKGYCPENCTLISRAEQNRNTRRTHRIKSDYGYLTASEAASFVGLDRSTVAKWVREGRVSTMEDLLRIVQEVKA